MIYTSVVGHGIPGSRVWPISRVGQGGTKPVVLDKMFIGGSLVKTGEYCPIRYEPAKTAYRRIVISPPHGRGVSYRDGNRRRFT